MTPKQFAGLVSLWLALAAAPLCAAQVSRGGGGGDAVARVQAMLQQERAKVAELNTANRRLKEEATKNEARIAALESQLKAAKRGEAALQTRLERTEDNVQSRSQQLERTQSRLSDVQTKAREIATNLVESEGRVASLSRDLSQRDAELGECTAKNAELLSINDEMVAYLRGESGTLDSLLRREPFTGIKRVQRENMADDFAYRADENAIATTPVVP